MTLETYIGLLKGLLEVHPEYKDVKVIHATDDEGNGYHEVIYAPTFCQIHDLEEYFLEKVGDFGDESIANEDINAVIIN